MALITGTEEFIFKIPEHHRERLTNMNTRIITARSLGAPKRDPKNPKRYLCRWCWGSLPEKGNRTFWCSDECVSQFQVLQPENIKRYVYRRDAGRCKLCDRDVEALGKQLDEWRGWTISAEALRRGYRIGRSYAFEKIERDAIELDRLDKLIIEAAAQHPDLWTNSKPGFRGYSNSARIKLVVPQLKKAHAYEIDHIIPLALGGSSLPDNLRVLCIYCHKVETGKLQGELAKRKRSEVRHSSGK